MLTIPIKFPIWKLRHYKKIKTNPLGVTTIETKDGIKIIDDRTIKLPTLTSRRMELVKRGQFSKLYCINEKVDYLRQLYKYKNNSKFIDNEGNLFTYEKSSKLYKFKALKIKQYCLIGDNTIFKVEGIYQPFIVNYDIKTRNIKYATIIFTSFGPFLYDLVKEYHEPFKKRI